MDNESASGPPHRPAQPSPTAPRGAGQDADAEPAHWIGLARELAGEPAGEGDAVAHEWRAAHPDDAAAVAALDETLDLLAFTPPADLDVEAALRRVRARRDAEAATPASPVQPPSTADVLPFRPRRTAATEPPRRWATPLRAAAAIAVIVGGAAVWQATRTSAGEVRTYATAIGQRDSVRLPDGSRVLLGPGSALDVPAEYGDGEREVRLRGEALFVVLHDTAHTFRVRTRGAEVHDVGTAFVVREDAAGGVMVSVSEGAVFLQAVRAQNASGSATRLDSTVVLHAGDRGDVAPGAQASVVRGGATADDDAWTRGALAFRDATVPEVVAQLQRWYGLELQLADSSLAGRHLTADFHGEPADQVLRVVGLALGATMERRGDTVTVRAAPAAGTTP